MQMSCKTHPFNVKAIRIARAAWKKINQPLMWFNFSKVCKSGRKPQKLQEIRHVS